MIISKPIFSLKCVACSAVHDGDLDKAVTDGWHITVYQLENGQVQFAGCPAHTEDWDNASLGFLKFKKVR